MGCAMVRAVLRRLKFGSSSSGPTNMAAALAEIVEHLFFVRDKSTNEETERLVIKKIPQTKT